jgi:CheY-like chemotaxis protein
MSGDPGADRPARPTTALGSRAGGTVLLVEDSDEDYETLDRALRRTRPELTLRRCVGGLGARRLISEAVEATDGAALPALVLLDLNMPDGDGRQLLAWLRAQPLLADVPVVVLTTSTNPQDVARSYDAGANGYVFKPLNYSLFEATIRGTVDYWIPRGPRS